MTSAHDFNAAMDRLRDDLRPDPALEERIAHDLDLTQAAARHDCPFTLGQLVAIAAIVAGSRSPGGPRLAAHVRSHALLHSPDEPEP